MPSEPETESTVPDGTFTIHSLNNYTNVFISSTAEALDLNSDDIGDLIHVLYNDVTRGLAKGGVDYADLRWALTPRSSHAEIAFVFDSTAAGSDHYGFEISKAWLPALWQHGPKRTAISQGDIGDAPSSWVWSELDAHLVREGDFPHLSTEQYYVVYFTNVNPAQVRAMDAALRDSTGAYMGYVDCSTWTPLKLCMLLPQYAIREGDALVVPTDEEGWPHIAPPEGGHGFRLVGVEDTLYGVVLDHRMDNGVPEWADSDSALGLTALGGAQAPLRDLHLELDERRFEYLTRHEDGHGASVRRAGLHGLSRDDLARAIMTKVESGLTFNLRFVRGTRGDEPAPENDALMFTVQVEFPDDAGKIKRYQVGIKYTPSRHTGEVVTFH
jgi:hypothetical protein